MVEDVFKNVQALKGITVDEFMGTMGIMSASLGLCCNDCHPGAGTDSGGVGGRQESEKGDGPPAWCSWCRPSTGTTFRAVRR